MRVCCGCGVWPGGTAAWASVCKAWRRGCVRAAYAALVHGRRWSTRRRLAVEACAGCTSCAAVEVQWRGWRASAVAAVWAGGVQASGGVSMGERGCDDVIVGEQGHDGVKE